MFNVKRKSAIFQRLMGLHNTREPYERIGFWGWFGLYITGVVLLFFLLSHVWLVHYGSTGTITARTTALALQSPIVKVSELGLLVFGVLHGMLGLRRTVLDLEVLKKRGEQYLTWCLVAAGVLLIATGLVIFSQLSSGIKGY